MANFEKFRQTVARAYEWCDEGLMSEEKRDFLIQTARQVHRIPDNVKTMPPALEQELRYIAGMCARGKISWGTKEVMCDIALEDFGWSREDLKAWNKLRERQ